VRIRTRLTLWYAAVMFAALALMGVLSYHEFVREAERYRAEYREHGEDRPDEHRAGTGRGRGGHFEQVAGIILWCGVPAAVLGLAGGWWLTRRALAPLEALTRAVERTHERSLHEQLPRRGGGDELDRLTEVFNAMTARLGESFQRIREFTLHASHELKTPLTVMQAELETASREESLSQPQRERLLSQLDEVQRLGKIVDGLSLLTKADAGQVRLALEPVPMDVLVREAFEDAQHLAHGRGLALRLEACDAVCVEGDRHRLRQVLLNLTDNSVKYNEPGGSVTMALRAAEGCAEIVVANTGPGIPGELLSRVFDRFFRGDASHGSAVEGCGLGLSIAQWIVHAHRGTIRVDSEAGRETRVTVRLPVAALVRPAAQGSA
jgi:signal transduction histidine kinase